MAREWHFTWNQPGNNLIVHVLVNFVYSLWFHHLPVSWKMLEVRFDNKEGNQKATSDYSNAHGWIGHVSLHTRPSGISHEC